MRLSASQHTGHGPYHRFIFILDYVLCSRGIALCHSLALVTAEHITVPIHTPKPALRALTARPVLTHSDGANPDITKRERNASTERETQVSATGHRGAGGDDESTETVF